MLSSMSIGLIFIQDSQERHRELGEYSDHRAKHSATLFDSYSIPHIHDVTVTFHCATIFSKIDLRQAYHQIDVASKDVEQKACTSMIALFEFPKRGANSYT